MEQALRQGWGVNRLLRRGGSIARCLLGAVAFLMVLCSAIYAPNKEGEPPRFCTVFNHMVKSGGTSIKQQMVQSSEREGDAEPGLCTVEGASTLHLCRDALYNSSVIMGYGELLRHPLEEIGREDCEFFTMMRHPISRLVSAFYYCPKDHDQQLRPRKWCGNMKDRQPSDERLLDFALNTSWRYMYYTEMLFGIYCSRDFELCEKEFQVKQKPHGMDTELGREALTKMEELLASYNAVGIFEEWDLSMELFNATVKTSVRSWDATVFLNGGVVPEERADLLEWAYMSPEINVALAADMMLYDYAVMLFQHQTTAILGKEWG